MASTHDVSSSFFPPIRPAVTYPSRGTWRTCASAGSDTACLHQHAPRDVRRTLRMGIREGWAGIAGLGERAGSPFNKFLCNYRRSGERIRTARLCPRNIVERQIAPGARMQVLDDWSPIFRRLFPLLSEPSSEPLCVRDCRRSGYAASRLSTIRGPRRGERRCVCRRTWTALRSCRVKAPTMRHAHDGALVSSDHP